MSYFGIIVYIEYAVHDLFWNLVAIEAGLAVVTFFALLWVVAPYGRNLREGFGPTISSRTAWIVMESPAVLWFTVVFTWGTHRFDVLPCLFFALWMLHYVHRAFVWPMRMRLTGRRMPILVAALAFAFNLLNATVNAAYISEVGDYVPADWLRPTLWCGAALFLAGFITNLHSDEILRNLRSDGETTYHMPQGGLFRWISSPNYLGEIIEWVGWAIMTRSPAGWAFALYTAANLVPRARSHHRWYRKRFPQLPVTRKALVPFLW